MPTEYIHINSALSTSTSSRVQVNLPAPMMHASSVSCVSASMPNDFFNVREGYNVFSLIVYRAVTGSNDFKQFDYTVPQGQYTIGGLVDTLNTLMGNNKPILPGSVADLTVVLSVLASGFITIQTNGVDSASTRRFVVLYSKDYWTSIARRLGFQMSQVVDTSTPSLIRNLGAGVVFTEDGGATYEALSLSDPFSYDILKVSSDPNTNIGTSDGVGFEAIGTRVVLRSSLVRDAYATTGYGGLQRSDILQEIPIDVGPHSYIHHRGYNKQALVHALDGRPITSFWVELCDEWGEPFGPRDFKHFSCILHFELEVDQASEAAHREQTLLTMDQQFRARHRC